jgi:hypothetical protein
MSTLTKEARVIQNPALGAVLLWRFACGYSGNHPTSNYPPLQLAFIVLPILLHRDTFDLLKGTQRATGLHGFADKFSRTNVAQSDVLLAIQSRAIAWRPLSLESLRMGIHTRLLTVSCAEGRVIPVTTSSASAVPDSVKPLLFNAEKLGAWCSALTLYEIGTALKVAF